MLSITLFFISKKTKPLAIMPIDYSRQTGKKIATKGHRRKFICVKNILYIQCEDHLATIFLNNGTTIHDIKTLREFEKELIPLGFFRIRNNVIINGNYITEMDVRIEKRVVKLKKDTFIVAKLRLKSFVAWVTTVG